MRKECADRGHQYLVDGGERWVVPRQEIVTRMPAADIAAPQAGVALLLGEDQRLQVPVEGVGIGEAKPEDRRAERVDAVFAWIEPQFHIEIGRASCRERVCKYV